MKNLKDFFLNDLFNDIEIEPRSKVESFALDSKTAGDGARLIICANGLWILLKPTLSILGYFYSNINNFDKTDKSRRFITSKSMIPTKPIETAKNYQKPTLLTSKTDETDKNLQKPTLLTSFLSVFLNTGTEIILLLSSLLTHRRTVSHCRVCRIIVEQFLILRAISHNFAKFPGISIRTQIIVWTVESWVFCVWIVWFILPRPQRGHCYKCSYKNTRAEVSTLKNAKLCKIGVECVELM